MWTSRIGAVTGGVLFIVPMGKQWPEKGRDLPGFLSRISRQPGLYSLFFFF